ncbi:hypothetical protein BOVATA_036130 [Babesia ovata]|uniref:Uncharacterized protein n=1 Tax=Babesia ovata TaxID=189622 RepID=A0A2H6KGJ1_9APIC|nr:uncharacterized protein BOVATA_036130 [Babesia ovata]GBE62120.1 hypothetical protein BOVATA_036130 [Babesia ovata]
MSSQKDERKMKAPAGDEGSNPPKRICTGGEKDGEERRRKGMDMLKRREKLMRLNRVLLDNLLEYCRLYNSPALDSLPVNSPSGTGGDGADANQDARHDIDHSLIQFEDILTRCQTFFDDFVDYSQSQKNWFLNILRRFPQSGDGPHGADGNPDNAHTAFQLVKRREELMLRNRALLNDLLEYCRLYNSPALASPPEKSPSDNGSDGADGNKDDTHAKDKLPPQDANDSKDE